MKHSFLILLLLSAVIPAIAAPNAADTISGKTLGEVVVEARTATPVADGIAYLPSQREKKTSSDYISLLDKMMIPIINVDMATRSVTTTNNQQIAYFINGHEASSMEVNGLLPKDVLKVTVLRMPSDPKYLGKSAVIDFTVKEYIWGGYTAADAYQSFILIPGATTCRRRPASTTPTSRATTPPPAQRWICSTPTTTPGNSSPTATTAQTAPFAATISPVSNGRI